ncbi:MAG: hypothetical protein SFV15_15845 [Polyangiaceae bacterium]|nr:hypothetical protein [Polyangiaceae bacterium]
MTESKESLALIAGLRSLEERQAPASVRRQVAERLEHTLFSTKPEKQLLPVFRFRLAPLSFAMVVVGTSGVLWASVHAVRAVWSPNVEVSMPVQAENQATSKVAAAHRKLANRNASPALAVPAPPAPEEAAPVSPVSPAPLTLSAKPTLPENASAEQQLPKPAKTSIASPSLPAVAAFELPSSAAAATPGLQEERAILDRARSFIRARNSHAAYQALAEHSARFANGRHAEEREALRVFNAALRSQAEGRAAALSFHNRYPHSLFWRGIAEELGIQ